MEDGEARLEVRRLDVRDQSPLEPRAQPVFQRGDFLGWTVRRDDDLLVDLVQGVEGVEELLRGTVLAREELNVVDQEDVHGAVLVTELAHASGGDRADHLVGELFGCQVNDPLARKTVVYLVTYRMHEMGLAKPHAPVEEQRVVAVARSFCDRLGG